MDKRGFIKTLEAVMAIIIVFLFIFYANRGSGDEETRFVEGIKSLEESILDDVSKNDEMRKCVVEYELFDCGTGGLDCNGNGKDDVSDGSAYQNEESPCFGTPNIGNYINEALPARFKTQGEGFDFVICGTTDEDFKCSLPGSISKSKEVYTSAVVITSSLSDPKYKPRILRLWLF